MSIKIEQEIKELRELVLDSIKPKDYRKVLSLIIIIITAFISVMAWFSTQFYTRTDGMVLETKVENLKVNLEKIEALSNEILTKALKER